jgi:hypothetical protein
MLTIMPTHSGYVHLLDSQVTCPIDQLMHLLTESTSFLKFVFGLQTEMLTSQGLTKAETPNDHTIMACLQWCKLAA